MKKLRLILESRIASGSETALAHFTLGKLCLDEGCHETAAHHLSRAVELDALYSAAWSLLGKSQAALERRAAAKEAYQSGIFAAEQKGELQAARQMRVFIARLEKQSGGKS